MRVLCSEGIANHTGPESCVVHREVYGEALTGEIVGQPLSRESDNQFRVPTPLAWRKAIWMGALLRVPVRPCVVLDPGRQRRSLFGNREISGLTDPGIPSRMCCHGSMDNLEGLIGRQHPWFGNSLNLSCASRAR